MSYRERLSPDAKLKDVIIAINKIYVDIESQSGINGLYGGHIAVIRTKLEKLEEYLKLQYVIADQTLPKYMEKKK